MPQETTDERGLQDRAGSCELIDQFRQSAQGGDREVLRNLFQNAEAVAALESADAELKTALLARPGVVDGLAESGSAASVIRVIDTLDTDRQTEILRALYAISGLLRNGESAAVFRLLGGLNADQKTAVLSEDGVVCDIARQRHGGKLMKLMKPLDWYRQATILERRDAIHDLRKYGQRRQVNAMLAGILAAQEPWLSQPAITH